MLRVATYIILQKLWHVQYQIYFSFPDLQFLYVSQLRSISSQPEKFTRWSTQYRCETRISLRHGISPEISQYLWIPGQIKRHEHPHRCQGVHAHDICGCELISSQLRRMFQPQIEQLQHISGSRIHIFNDW